MLAESRFAGVQIIDDLFFSGEIAKRHDKEDRNERV
jgi:hypothetical protein